MAKKKELKPVVRRVVTVRIVGISPLIQHSWSDKAKEMMRAKQQEGKKTKVRDIRDPERETKEAAYWCDKEKTIPGLLASSVKNAVIETAHNDTGIAKTLVRKALFIYPAGRDSCVPLETVDGKGKPEYEMVEDMVRVGQGSADLRYRPYYFDWAATTTWELVPDNLLVDDFLLLLERAGYTVGLNEWRPEKGGEYGRFRIDPKFKVIDKPFS